MDGGYNQDDGLRDQQTTNAKAKLSDLTKADLVELIGHLEHEVHSRDSVINEMMSQQTREVLYQSKYGRFGVSDPFTALQRDSEKVTNDNFDHNQVKSLFDNQLQQLENLIETQRRAQSTMREQKLSADERYKKVCQDLDEARRRHARDTAQGDDVTVALEKEREKLQQDLTYTKAQLKKSEKELQRTKGQLEKESQVAVKHKQVALDLIKERRRMVSKVAESEKKNHAIAELLQKEQEDNKKSENSKLLQLEARMEKQLMDFDIEREQYKTRLRKEESKVRDLLLQLTDIKETVLSLQQESNDTIIDNSVGNPGDLPDSSVYTSTTNITPVSLIKSLSHTMTVSKAPATTNDLKARASPRPILPQAVRQSNAATGQPRVSQAQLRPAAPVTSPKPVTHNMMKSQGDNQVRTPYNRQEATSRTAAISNSASIRLPSQVANVKQNSPSNKQEVSSTPIPSRLSSRPTATQAASPRHPAGASPRMAGPQTSTPRATGPQTVVPRVTSPQTVGPRATSPQTASPRVTTPQTASPRINKLTSTAIPITNQLNSPLQVSTTTSNNVATRSTVMSPRSMSVPPHLGTSLTIMEPKLVGASTVSVANWRNSLSSSSVPPSDPSNAGNVTPTTVSLITTTDKSTMVSARPKPPPPVRNVSLPSSKKYHSIENTS